MALKIPAPSVSINPVKKRAIHSKNEPETIKSMFGLIASKYDLANGILSFNLHKLWNLKLVKSAELSSPDILLDLCAGTGEISYLWLKRQKKPKTAILLDFCAEMLNIAQKRAPKNHTLSFIEGDAQAIPLPNNTIDAITVAYGIRNVKEPKKCFSEAYRTLKPGGTFSILELTEPKNPLVKIGHQFYLNKILPVLGGIITRKPEAYRYLSTSIQSFVSPLQLSKELSEEGFTEIKAIPLTGGIAHLITCKK